MLVLSAVVLAGVIFAGPTPLAFPDAEGYGRFSEGGRGGDVYHVTNLDDSGPGSLRDGVKTQTGPRTIVFDLSGTIALKSPLLIEKSHLTIAGQTAPGDGITIRDYNLHLKKASHIIIRYLRVRLGDQNKQGDDAPDCITVDYCDNVILDHISASWGIDGIQDTRGCTNYTLQWSIFSEALNNSVHPKGAHAMCASFRAPLSNMSIHHNIFASSRDRHPTIGGSVQDPQWIIDFRNNVIYNWSGAANVCDNQVNLINNYFRPGPESKLDRPPVAMKASLPDRARGHMSGNIFEGNDGWTKNNYTALDFVTWLKRPDSGYKYAGTVNDWKVEKPYDLGNNTPATQPAKDAYELVLGNSGASLTRDAVDLRFIQELRDGKGKLLDSQKEVGGWPTLKSAESPKDTDQDGMPDAWESANGLDSASSDDRNGVKSPGDYTNLELYLDILCKPANTL
ncbi:MAG: pectate lyase [Candidatus Hydrogenedentes bacterium]|nr:pectate lyase [Candidatus Hydrogenedentota bacterium]